MKSNNAMSQEKKKPYAAPALKHYGEMRALTQSGSAGLMEGAMLSMMRRP